MGDTDGVDPDWDQPTDQEIAETATLDDDERCHAPTPNGPCRLRDNHIGSDTTHWAPGGPGTADGVPVDTSGYYVGDRLDITIADGEPFIPGDYSVGDTFFGTIPGAPWVWPTRVGAVRRNPARPVPARLGRRSVAVSVTKYRLDTLGRSLDRLVRR